MGSEEVLSPIRPLHARSSKSSHANLSNYMYGGCNGAIRALVHTAIHIPTHPLLAGPGWMASQLRLSGSICNLSQDTRVEGYRVNASPITNSHPSSHAVTASNHDFLIDYLQHPLHQKVTASTDYFLQG